MYALAFDTETTGLTDFKKASIDPCQPTLVQIGARLWHLEERRVYQTLDVIVYPDNWTIPVEASNVHGVPQALAERQGIFLEHAVLAFRDMLGVSDYAIAHNIKYDTIVMERASAMTDLRLGQEVGTLWPERLERHCTMMHATPIVKKPARRKMHANDFAWPKLIELHKFLFNGEGFDGAHSAIVDIDAMMRCFFRMVDLGMYDSHPTLCRVPKREIEDAVITTEAGETVAVTPDTFSDQLAALVAAGEAAGLRQGDVMKAFNGVVQAYRARAAA